MRWPWQKRPAPAPPVVESEWGVTTEWCRRQAATNMRLDPVIKAAVEASLIQKHGSEEAGMAAARRQFPEAYPDDEVTP